MSTMYAITGNTFPYRSDLRQAGCTWNATAKAWLTPDPEPVRQAIPWAFGPGVKGPLVITLIGAPAPDKAPAPAPVSDAELLAQDDAEEALLALAEAPKPVALARPPITGVSFGPRVQDTDRRTVLFEQYATAREVIQASGLDWTARLDPLYLADGREVNHRAVVRSDTERVLGVVSSKYRGAQNVDAMEFFDGVVLRGEAQYAGAGMFRGGREVYIQARMLGADETIGDSTDVVRPYILLRNTHDGTGALTIGFSVTRVLCENTLAAALAEAAGDARTRRLRHVGNIAEQLEAAGQALDGIRQEWRTTAQAYRTLAARPMGYSAAQEYFAASLAGISASERIMGEVLGRVDDLYVRGNGAIVGSAWGAYNAVTNYLSHERGRDRTRKESLLVGDSAKLSQRALTLALAA